MVPFLFPFAGKGRGRGALIWAAGALVLIALPGRRGAQWMTPRLANLFRDKYVLGELLLLFSLLRYLSVSAVNHLRLDTKEVA